MNYRLTPILDECLERLRAGATIEECLEAYPEYADELAPLLEMLVAVRQLKEPATPRPEAVSAGRQRFLEHARRLQRREQGGSPIAEALSRVRGWFDRGVQRPATLRWAMTALVAFLVFVVISGTVVVASENSLPGDALYPVKRAVEAVQIQMTFDESVRAELRRQHLARRQKEIQTVVEQRREVQVTFEAAITSMEETRWSLEGFPPLLITPETVIEGQPLVGAWVRVKAFVQADGFLRAEHIAVVSWPATPTPSLVPTASPSPTATLLPTPTPRPLPTDTPPPDVVPSEGGERVAPVEKAVPSPTPTLSPVPSPTATPSPTSTPMPTRLPTVRFEGYIEAIEGKRWTIGGQVVIVTSQTLISPPGQAVVGAYAVVVAERQPDGSLVAMRITIRLAPGEPVIEEFSGRIESLGKNQWVVAGRTISITPDTHIEGTPRIGAMATVRAQRLPSGTLVALSIVVASEEPTVQFAGPIQHIGKDSWVVGGRTVLVDAETDISGTPVVGRIAEVTARVRKDGTLYAVRIVVRAPATQTPEPGFTPTQVATAPATVAPTPISVTPPPMTRLPGPVHTLQLPTGTPGNPSPTPVKVGTPVPTATTGLPTPTVVEVASPTRVVPTLVVTPKLFTPTKVATGTVFPSRRVTGAVTPHPVSP